MMFDWHIASRDQCKLLYRPLRMHVRIYALEWKPFLDSIYREMSGADEVARPHANQSDQDGLSKGRLDRVKLNLIWRWTTQHYPEDAKKIHGQVTGAEPKNPLAFSTDGSSHARLMSDPNRWPKFMAAHGINGEVDVELAPFVSKDQPLVTTGETVSIPEFIKPSKKTVARTPTSEYSRKAFLDAVKKADKAMSVQLEPRNPVSKTLVKLSQRFRFSFEREVSGPVLAIQRTRGPSWKLLSISGYDPYVFDQTPFQTLPVVDNGRPVYLTEENETGRHQFGFLFAPTEFLSPLSTAVNVRHEIAIDAFDTLIDQLEAGDASWSIMTLDVMFVV